MSKHVNDRGDHTTVIEAAVDIVSELQKRGFEVSPHMISRIARAAGGGTHLIINLTEAGLELLIIGNLFKQNIMVYTTHKRQAIKILISMMGGRKSGRVRVRKPTE